MGRMDGHASVGSTLTAPTAHRTSGTPHNMRTAFAEDPDRFNRPSAEFGDLLLDWSMCSVNAETMQLLLALAETGGHRGRTVPPRVSSPTSIG